jgi:hypothetical protein
MMNLLRHVRIIPSKTTTNKMKTTYGVVQLCPNPLDYVLKLQQVQCANFDFYFLSSDYEVEFFRSGVLRPCRNFLYRAQFFFNPYHFFLYVTIHNFWKMAPFLVVCLLRK